MLRANLPSFGGAGGGHLIITSFGSAFTKHDEPLYSEIIMLGNEIGKSGWDVCSGGYSGTMEAISRGVKESGGKTIGVSVKGWTSLQNKWIDEEICAENLMERILKLINISDAYIIFKGGTGTLVEISVTLELMNKKAMKEKPVIFYTDFWKNVIEILKEDSERLKELIERNVRFISTANELNLNNN
jgi:uncharacterized protein (TIGR00730 family)